MRDRRVNCGAMSTNRALAHGRPARPMSVDDSYSHATAMASAGGHAQTMPQHRTHRTGSSTTASLHQQNQSARPASRQSRTSE